MMKSIPYLAAFAAAFTGVQAGLDLDSSNNIAVYWGKF
jgi:chitinase